MIVLADLSLFRSEWCFKLCRGRNAAHRWARRWVWRHPHGKAWVMTVTEFRKNLEENKGKPGPTQYILP